MGDASVGIRDCIEGGLAHMGIVDVHGTRLQHFECEATICDLPAIAMAVLLPSPIRVLSAPTHKFELSRIVARQTNMVRIRSA